VKNLFMIARSCGYTTHREVAAAQAICNRGLSGEGSFLDIKENACGDGLRITGNSLVKNLRDKKKGGKARL
jgi:putative transposase